MLRSSYSETQVSSPGSKASVKSLHVKDNRIDFGMILRCESSLSGYISIYCRPKLSSLLYKKNCHQNQCLSIEPGPTNIVPSFPSFDLSRYLGNCRPCPYFVHQLLKAIVAFLNGAGTFFSYSNAIADYRLCKELDFKCKKSSRAYPELGLDQCRCFHDLGVSWEV